MTTASIANWLPQDEPWRRLRSLSVSSIVAISVALGAPCRADDPTISDPIVISKPLVRGQPKLFKFSNTIDKILVDPPYCTAHAFGPKGLIIKPNCAGKVLLFVSFTGGSGEDSKVYALNITEPAPKKYHYQQ